MDRGIWSVSMTRGAATRNDDRLLHCLRTSGAEPTNVIAPARIVHPPWQQAGGRERDADQHKWAGTHRAGLGVVLVDAPVRRGGGHPRGHLLPAPQLPERKRV